jgi:hypothetical protein
MILSYFFAVPPWLVILVIVGCIAGVLLWNKFGNSI